MKKPVDICEVIEELEKAKKSLIGLYNKDTPLMERGSCKVAFNAGLDKAIEIIRKRCN